MYIRRPTTAIAPISQRPQRVGMGADMAHGPSWYRAMGGVQSRPTGPRARRAVFTGQLGSLGADTLAEPTILDPLAQATREWQDKVLAILKQGADTMELQKWLQIAATLSIPLAAAAWRAIWPSLGKRFARSVPSAGV